MAMEQRILYERLVLIAGEEAEMYDMNTKSYHSTDYRGAVCGSLLGISDVCVRINSAVTLQI